MDEAATRWISPYCMLSEQGEGVDGVPELQQFQVWVLHPGPEGVGDAEVTVRLYNSIDGELVGSDTKTLKPRTSAQFNPGLFEFGWLQIQSNKPVLPWGLTPWESGSAHGLMGLTWYRREPVAIVHDLARAISSTLKRL
jgi:hypothetical protein